MEEGATPPGGGDPGWPELVDFLSVAGLSDAPLERVLTLLTAEDVTNLGHLRKYVSALSPRLKAGTRNTIADALAATPAQPAATLADKVQSAAPPKISPPVAFNVVVSFGKHEATVRIALPGERL